MKKSDLRTGMKVELENGQIYDVLLNVKFISQITPVSALDILMECEGAQYLNLWNFFDDLDYYTGGTLNIKRIYEPLEPLSLNRNIKKYPEHWTKIWERIKPKKMTLEEVETLLGYKIEIIN